MSSFYHELCRSKVLRVTGIYLLVALVLLEAVIYFGSAIGFPQWSFELAVAFAVLGVPLTVLLSWVYEITPDGIKRQSELDIQPTPMHMTRMMHSIISSLIILAVGFIAWELEFRHGKALGGGLDYILFSESGH